MKKTLLSVLILLLAFAAHAQFVAKLEVKGPLPGACDSTNVYAMFPGFKGQVAPVPPMSDKEIEKMLNDDVQYIKDHPKFSGKMMIHIVVNCKGEMIQCEVDNKSGEPDFDADVLHVFQKMRKWTAGTLDGNAVDCSVLYSIEVKKGKITVG